MILHQPRNCFMQLGLLPWLRKPEQESAAFLRAVVTTYQRQCCGGTTNCNDNDTDSHHRAGSNNGQPCTQEQPNYCQQRL